MSGRVTKTRQRDTTAERKTLLSHIDKFGSFDTMPCIPCFRRKVPCRMAENSSRCLECVRVSRACDGVLVGGSLERTHAALERIEAQADEAEDQLASAQQKALEAHREAAEALARLTRLRQQKRYLRDRGNDLFARGMEGLDELDQINSDLNSFGEFDVQVLESESVENVQSVGGFGVVDWNAISGGTVATAGDTSSSAT